MKVSSSQMEADLDFLLERASLGLHNSSEDDFAILWIYAQCMIAKCLWQINMTGVITHEQGSM